MKKTIFTLLALVSFGLVLTSCKKDEEAPQTSTGSARVEGYIKINSNLRNDTLQDGTPQVMREAIPGTVTLTFTIDSYYLDKNPDPSYSYDVIQRTAKVDASGHYSVSLPTPASSVTIPAKLMISDFEYNPIISSSQNTDSLAERVVESGVTQNFSIYNGETKILDYNY